MTASIDAYRSVNVGTCSPRQVVLRLYRTAVRRLEEAESILAANGDASVPLHTVHEIVGGLLSALDFGAGDLSRRLLSLYLFVLERLDETRAGGRDAGLADARKVLATLLSAWEAMPAEEARAAERAPEKTGLSLRG